MVSTAKPTQDFIPIKEIRDGVVILKNGSLRGVIMASTLNFSLKSEDEQNAIIMQYQNFLNSLDFPVQFFVESRALDIAPYLLSLQKAEKEQPNELLRIQIKEYMLFIKNIVKTTNVVSKAFYVVIPYQQTASSTKKGFLSSLGFGGGSSKDKTKEKEEEFESKKMQLGQRVEAVRQGLMSSGVKTVPLNTEELIELFYKLFNPGELEKNIGVGEVSKE